MAESAAGYPIVIKQVPRAILGITRTFEVFFPSHFFVPQC